ncbi:hypothetical protein A2U01_0049489, partial [Trifolium medium]|nr:hypothetical protein [Trifolium medium]
PPFTAAALTGTDPATDQKTTTTVHGGSLERNQPKRKSPDGDQLIRVRWCRNRERVDRTTNSRGYMAMAA